MRILYHHRIRSKDGQAVHLEELVRGLRELGHEVRIVGPNPFAQAQFGHDPSFLTKAKAIVPRPLYEIAELGYNLPAFFRLCAAYLSFRPDFIYERYNLYALAGVLLKRLTGTPVLLEVNAPLASERQKYGGLAFPKLARILEGWTWRNSSAVFPVTRVLAQEIRKSGVGETQIAVIPNAVNPGMFDETVSADKIKQQLKISGKLVIGFTGFAREWHCLDTVIELFARADVPQNLHAVIVGEGPAIENLKALSRTLNVVDRVTFTGLVDRGEIANVIRAFDVALLPSCVEYCSPLKLFEYLALGKAIVAPDQPNIREIVSDGVSAALFDPAHQESMAETVLRLAQDAETRERLSRGARALIVSRGLTWQANARRVIERGGQFVRSRGRRRVLIPQ